MTPTTDTFEHAILTHDFSPGCWSHDTTRSDSLQAVRSQLIGEVTPSSRNEALVRFLDAAGADGWRVAVVLDSAPQQIGGISGTRDVILLERRVPTARRAAEVNDRLDCTDLGTAVTSTTSSPSPLSPA